MHSSSVFPHLFSFPVTFMVYFSPTQVTFVSNPEENPIWYPTEKAKAANRNANTKASIKLNNLPKVFQNLSMAPSFIGASSFPLLLLVCDPFVPGEKIVVNIQQNSRQGMWRP